MIKQIFFLIFFVLGSIASPHVFAEDSYGDIALSKVPLKIMTAAKKEFFAIKFTEAEMVLNADGEMVYELEGIKDNKKYVVQVNDTGKVVKSGPASDFESEMKERELSKLPSQIRQAVEKTKEGIQITGFAKEKEYSRVVYEVEGTVDGKCYEIEVSLQGDILETGKCD